MTEKLGWGGARVGAGRKPTLGVAGMPHLSRPEHVARFPVLVTLKVVEGLPTLRSKLALKQIRASFRRVRERVDFGVVHFSVQSNHFHFIAEADDARALSNGISALEISLAKRLNRLFGRRGQVFADRYHARDLRTPREVRAALAYVLMNSNKHSGRSSTYLDPFSSAAALDGGWTSRPANYPAAPPDDVPVKAPRTWLLIKGWKKWGLLSPAEIPGRQAH